MLITLWKLILIHMSEHFVRRTLMNVEGS